MSYFKSPSKKPKVILAKQELSCFPFQDFASVPISELDKASEEYSLSAYSSWMLPQMLAHFGAYKCVKNSSGDYDATQTLTLNVGKDPFKIGLWKVAARLRRGSLVKGQNTPTGAAYSALVPLILAGIKQYQNINYSEWSRESIPLLVDSLLADAMLVESIPDLPKSRLLEIRKTGLTTMSGAKAGTTVNPVSKWSLTGIKDTELGSLPTHVITMMCQTWVAHPSIRHKNMVLDPMDWDGPFPTPLIDATVEILTVEGQQARIVANGSDIPWL